VLLWYNQAMKQERCIILIGGSNFYFKLKDLALSNLLDFDFSSFGKTLCCDRIYLLSSDTDLLPAIKQARKKGKAVTYVGFSHQPSVAMVATCSESRLLTKEDLSRHIKPTQAKAA